MTSATMREGRGPSTATPLVALPSAMPAAPSPDDALIALCRLEVARMNRLDALWTAFADVVHEPAWVEAECDALVLQGEAAQDVLAAMPARTLVGLRAKASVLRAQWGEDLHVIAEKVAASLVVDALRLLPGEGALT